MADLLQQISTAMGGIGYLPDKLFMHPRRWAFFCSALDSQSRPFVVPEAGGGVAMNSLGLGNPSGYGGPVGRLMGMPVYPSRKIDGEDRLDWGLTGRDARRMDKARDLAVRRGGPDESEN